MLLLDGVLVAAVDWDKAEAERKPDFLAHRGSRLSDAQALASRGADWAREVAPAQAYLTACTQRESAEREEKEAALAREQERLAEIAAGQARTARLQRITRWAFAAVGAVILIAGGIVGWLQWDKARQLETKEVALAESRQQLDQAQAKVAAEQASNAALNESLDRRKVELDQANQSLNRRQLELEHAQANFLAELAGTKLLRTEHDSALRLAARGTRIDLALPRDVVMASPATAALAAAVSQSNWRLSVGGHGKQVASAAFSPDGSRIVTASSDKTARVWDAATGKEIAVLRGHEDEVTSAAFSPDGSRIVTASWDKTARIWDAATAQGDRGPARPRGRGDFRRLQPRRVAHRHGVR